ncbi:MAG: M48 family metalloprotease [Candidatus Eremiobacteraeota bacterium]|nr:M48 family metalloprotease [Candidatus Eremiobacteraeota bacterium]
MVRFIRRIVPIAVIVSLLGAICPAPALALSTQTEIQIGQETDKQITASSVIETDPLLNAWVGGISAKLWKQVARKDVPYNIKIIKSNDVNAFSTMGGYVYLYEGLLDFAQSDDELAGVIGHETGHIERRHAVTMQAKAQGLNLLFGILSLFSPLVYRFGNLAQAGIMAKMSRVDELQADQYGLLLMSRAGYDPQSNVSFMRHLGTLADEHSDLVTKYLQDHPNPKARVGHMVGYEELDPTKVTAQQRLVRASHDLDEARYNIAMMQFAELVKEDPNNQQALLGLGQSQLALGETSKSEQTLGEALQKGNPAVKAAAKERMTALRAMETHRVSFAQPNLAALRTKMDQAAQTQTQAVASVGARHDQGRDQIKAIQGRLDSISYEIPNFSRVDIKRGSRLESVVKDITGMARSVNSALEDSGTAVNGVGSLNTKTNKVDGLLRENEDILAEMKAPLRDSPVAAASVAVLPSYPRMYSELAQADGDMVRAVDAGRAAAMQLDQSLGDLDAFLKRLQQVQLNYFGDISLIDYTSVLPLMQKADESLGAAAVSASQAAQLYNMARSNQLAARITLLGLGTSPQRYATLQKALEVRFDDQGPDYATMLRRDLTPGEVAAATIVAADTKTSTAAILRQAAETHRSVIDVANARGMHAEALEIFLGLVYLDYTDDPFKETHPLGSTQTSTGF